MGSNVKEDQEGKMGFRTVMAVVAIFLSSLASMGDAVPGVIYNDIYQAFPDDMNAVSTLISMPQLVIVFGSIVATALLRKMSKRDVLILGITLFGIGGIFGAAVDNVWYMIAMRIPYGLGMAFINVVGVAFLAELFVDEGRRATMVGLYNAVMALLGAVLSLVAGQLAAGGWRQVYLCYWIAVPILALFVIFLPHDAVEKAGGDEAKPHEKSKLGRRFWTFTITFAFFDMLFCVFTFFISTFVAENALGDASLSALLISAYTVGGFAGGLLFGLVYRVAGKYSAAVGYMLGVICMIGLWSVPAPVIAIALSFLIGMAYNMALTYAYSHVPSVVPTDRVNDCIGIVTAAYGLGSAVATYFTTFLMGLIGSTRVTPVFLIGGLLMTVCAVVEAVSARMDISQEAGMGPIETEARVGQKCQS